MIIWRGLGILSLLFVGLGVGLGFALNGLFGGTAKQPSMVAMGLGFLVLNLAGAALGYWLNEVQPKQKLEKYGAARWAELQQLVQQGRFQFSPGQAPPRSPQEGYAQAQQLMNSEMATLRKRGRNVHTFMFIPMQYVSAIAALTGLTLLVLGLVRG